MASGPVLIPGWTFGQHIARGTHADIYELLKDGCENEKGAAKVIRLPNQLDESKQEILDKLKKVIAYNNRMFTLHHENIVKFFDISIALKDSAVLIMELLEGKTLEKFIQATPQSEDTIERLSKQICSALEYLHTLENPAIHRDINGRTIMVSEDEKIKLIDFGLTIELVESASDHVSGAPRGDPYFMAPEQFLSDDMDCTAYSTASDIWAFGTVYQMASGKRPHSECKNMLTILNKVVRHGAPVLPESCSDRLKDFYLSCTAKDRSSRKSAAELLKHNFLSRQSVASPPSTPVPPPEFKAHEEQRYPMTSPMKGYCLVIDVQNYSDTARFPHRPEQQSEVQNIHSQFEQLEYKIVSPSDGKAASIWKMLHGIANVQNHCSFVCVIIAYGECDRIYTSDGEEIKIKDILARFSANQCPELKEKPKLFFVQTAKQKSDVASSSFKPSIRLPESDFLICSASLDEPAGVSLMQTLCAVLVEENLRDADVESVIAEINRRLNLPQLRKGTERFCGSSSVSSLQKKFYAKRQTQYFSDLSPEEWTDEELVSRCNWSSNTSRTFGPLDQTLLMIAATRGRDDLVSQLLKQPTKGSVSAQDVQGRTAISCAALKGHDNVLAAFEKAFENDMDALKMEVNREDYLCQTPIILAAMNNQTGVLTQLKRMQADVNHQDKMLFTPISFAAKLGFEVNVSKLLKLCADPTRMDISGNTPLIWAARFGQVGVIRILGGHVMGVDYWFHRGGERCMTAQQWAQFNGHTECALLIETIIRSLVSRMESSETPHYWLPDEPGDLGDGSNGASNNCNSNSSAPRQSGFNEAGGAQGGSGYPMTPNTQTGSIGIALMINIVEFSPNSGLSERIGAMEDFRDSRLNQSFTKLGFKCYQYLNVSTRFFNRFPSNGICPSEELARSSALLICFMSHGEQDNIFASDGKVNLEEQVFSQVRLCPELHGKPKIFILQACREIPNDRFVPRKCSELNARKHEDCLYLYSVVRGDSSIRNSATGGLFAKALSDVIRDDYDQNSEEFVSIMPKVVQRVHETSSRRQVPCSNSTLTRRLFFPSLG